MKTVSLVRRAAYGGNLILVNGEYPLCKGFCAQGLVPAGENTHPVRLALGAATVLQTLLEDVRARDEIIAVSGFRSRYEQACIYESSLQENGAAFTAKYVARPDHSEHQSGLAVDLALLQPEIDTLRPYFPYKGICGAFRSKAPQYGFIERYPKGKEGITGIAHEPWHFRYVGVPHSIIMQDMRITLEEYHLWLKEHPYGRRPFRYVLNNTHIEIFYLPAGENEALFEVSDNQPYMVSGDNMGGFIVTQWRAS